MTFNPNRKMHLTALVALSLLAHFSLCDHDYLFVAASPNVPFDLKQTPSEASLLLFLQSNNLSTTNIIFSVLTDDIGQSNMDSVVLNKELDQRLRFQQFPPAPNFGYGSSNVSSQDSFTEFCSHIETLTALSIQSFTDSVENFETVFSRISEQIEELTKAESEYVFIMYLHGNRKMYIKERILASGNFLCFRYENNRNVWNIKS